MVFQWVIKTSGLTHQTAKTGGITLIQRFGSALNLNVHFHMLLLDGVYTTNRYRKHRFQYVSAPLSDELTSLVHTISHRIACFLERQGLLERDMEQSYLTLYDGLLMAVNATTLNKLDGLLFSMQQTYI